MVYSTTGVTSQERVGDAFFYVRKQVISAFIGVVMLMIGYYLPIRIIEKFSWIAFPLSFLLLVLTHIPGLHDEAGGAVRWINLVGIRFQPGELVKLLMVVFIAGYFARQEQKLNSFVSAVIIPFSYAGVIAALFLAQPDFGSASVLTLIIVGMGCACGIPIRFLALCGSALTVAAGALVFFSPYRMARVVSFLSPFEDASGKGYQLIQSLIALGSGHLTGVGLGESQQKLFFLPAAHTDFIFAVIGEELGFLGCAAVIALFMIFLWKGFAIAQSVSNNTFKYALAVGLTLFIVVPALLNMGVVSGLLPTKGLVLPLVGYGGTNLIASLFAVGLLLNLTRAPDNRN